MNYKFEFKLFINILEDVVNSIIDNEDIITKEYYDWVYKAEVVGVSINSEYVHFKLCDCNGQHFTDAKPLKEVLDLIGYRYE
jgi:hypothetical protein